MQSENFLDKVKCRFKVWSKVKPHFAFSAIETRPETAANSNSAKVLMKGWRRCHTSKGFMLGTGKGQGLVKCHRMKI